jgi:hypothetical protein
MSCNPTRLELSNTDATTVIVTLTTDPGDGTAVVLEFPGLSISETENASGGEVSYTIAARTEDTHSLWDGTIQIGSNAPADIVAHIVETSSAQTIGVTITDSDVTYCAPIGGSGGSSLIVGVDSFPFIFANADGYAEGQTVALILNEPLISPLPSDDTLSWGGALSGTDYSDKLVSGVLMTEIAVPAYTDIYQGFTQETSANIALVDANSRYDPWDRHIVCMPAGHCGMAVEELQTPNFASHDGNGLDVVNYNYARVLRSHETQACIAAIDSIATSGIDGGTF